MLREVYTHALDSREEGAPNSSWGQLGEGGSGKASKGEMVHKPHFKGQVLQMEEGQKMNSFTGNKKHTYGGVKCGQFKAHFHLHLLQEAFPHSLQTEVCSLPFNSRTTLKQVSHITLIFMSQLFKYNICQTVPLNSKSG